MEAGSEEGVGVQREEEVGETANDKPTCTYPYASDLAKVCAFGKRRQNNTNKGSVALTRRHDQGHYGSGTFQTGIGKYHQQLVI